MPSFLTDIELLDLQTSGLNRETPFIIAGVSHTYFFVARHYGAVKYQGVTYICHPLTGELIRQDVVKWVEKGRKVQLKASLESKKAETGELNY
jgi:hypothetical protein